MNVPSLVILTPGHAGSSVVAWMLSQLGWQLPPDQDEFAESPTVRRINSLFIQGKKPEAQALARDFLRDLRQPWLLKDPRFCHTLQDWVPELHSYAPALLHLTRDVKELRESRVRRGRSPKNADERVHLCRQLIAQWPWAGLSITFEQLQAALAGWKPERIGAGADGHGNT